MEFKNLPELILYFKDEETCRKYLEKIFWNNKPQCPRCFYSNKIYRFKDGKTFKCAACKKKFSVLIGTPMENSNLPLQKWLIAIFLLSSNKKGISSHQLARQISTTQSTAWFMLHRIREMMNVKHKQLEGVVEADETFVGGKNKNRHHDKKVKNSQGRSFKDKTPVFGVMERKGKVISAKVSNTNADSILPLLFENVSPYSTLMTDEWKAYSGIGDYFERHGVVFHGKGQYVQEDAYTNNMECYWSHFKRSVIGCYHNISRKYMNFYCKEFDFRFNTRKLSDIERFNIVLYECKGKWIPFKILIDTE